MELSGAFSGIERIQELISVPNPQNVNCHKALLYLAGRISYEELTSDAKLAREQGLDFTFGAQAREMSEKEFVSITNHEELRALTEKECSEGTVCVGQIWDAKDNDMAHSFLLTKRGQDFTCFDKAGFKEPFSTYSIEELLMIANYQNQSWRFFPLREVK